MQCVLTGEFCFYLCTSIGWKSASRRVTVTNLLSSQFCCWNKVKWNCEMLFGAFVIISMKHAPFLHFHVGTPGPDLCPTAKVGTPSSIPLYFKHMSMCSVIFNSLFCFLFLSLSSLSLCLFYLLLSWWYFKLKNIVDAVTHQYIWTSGPIKKLVYKVAKTQ